MTTEEQPEGIEPGTSAENSEPTSETFKVSGDQLLAKIKELIKAGNIRRIIISHDGKTLLEAPVNVTAAGMAVAAVLSPVLVAIGAIAAVVSQVEVTVVRN